MTQYIRPRTGANLTIDAPVIEVGNELIKTSIVIGSEGNSNPDNIVVDTEEFRISDGTNTNLEVNSINYIDSPSSTLSEMSFVTSSTAVLLDFIPRFGVTNADPKLGHVFFQRFGNLVYFNGYINCGRPAGAVDGDIFSLDFPVLGTYGGVKHDSVGTVSRVSGTTSLEQLILTAGPNEVDTDRIYIRKTDGSTNSSVILTAGDLNEVVNLAMYFEIIVHV